MHFHLQKLFVEEVPQPQSPQTFPNTRVRIQLWNGTFKKLQYFGISSISESLFITYLEEGPAQQIPIMWSYSNGFLALNGWLLGGAEVDLNRFGSPSSPSKSWDDVSKNPLLKRRQLWKKVPRRKPFIFLLRPRVG